MIDYTFFCSVVEISSTFTSWYNQLIQSFDTTIPRRSSTCYFSWCTCVGDETWLTSTVRTILKMFKRKGCGNYYIWFQLLENRFCDFSQLFEVTPTGSQQQHALIFPKVFITRSADLALGPIHHTGRPTHYEPNKLARNISKTSPKNIIVIY